MLCVCVCVCVCGGNVCIHVVVGNWVTSTDDSTECALSHALQPVAAGLRSLEFSVFASSEFVRFPASHPL